MQFKKPVNVIWNVYLSIGVAARNYSQTSNNHIHIRSISFLTLVFPGFWLFSIFNNIFRSPFFHNSKYLRFPLQFCKFFKEQRLENFWKRNDLYVQERVGNAFQRPLTSEQGKGGSRAEESLCSVYTCIFTQTKVRIILLGNPEIYEIIND